MTCTGRFAHSAIAATVFLTAIDFMGCGGHHSWMAEGSTTETTTEVATTLMSSGLQSSTSSSEPVPDTSSSSTGEILPVCGNQMLESSEECDDGNLINNDYCTNLCATATCNDNALNGNESDIDCGGDCDKCSAGKTCHTQTDCPYSYDCDASKKCNPPYASCEKILAHNPLLHGQDGSYFVDPDGDGSNLAFTVICDMTTDGGGWTRVLLDTFEDGETAKDWLLNGNPMNQDLTTMCGSFGNILGSYDIFEEEDLITKQVDLLNLVYTQVRLSAEFIAIDSWNGDSNDLAYAQIDNEQIWNISCDFDSDICNQKSSISQCGNNDLSDDAKKDGKIKFDEFKPYMQTSTVVIGFGAILTNAGEESWGIDNVAVYVR